MTILLDREQTEQFRKLLEAGDEAGMREMVAADPLFLANSAESFYLRATKVFVLASSEEMLRVFQLLDELGHSAQMFGDDALLMTLTNHHPEVSAWLLDHGAIMRRAGQSEWMETILRGEGQLNIAQAWQWKPGTDLGQREWQCCVLAAGALLGTPAETLDILAATATDLDAEALWMEAYRWLNFYAAEKREGQSPVLSPTPSSAQWLRERVGQEGVEKLIRELDEESRSHLHPVLCVMDHATLGAKTPSATANTPRRSL